MHYFTNKMRIGSATDKKSTGGRRFMRPLMVSLNQTNGQGTKNCRRRHSQLNADLSPLRAVQNPNLYFEIRLNILLDQQILYAMQSNQPYKRIS